MEIPNEFTYRNEDGEVEKVTPERWGWGVVYKDNSELHQFAADGTFHRIAEIDVEQVKLFVMYRLDDMSKRYDVVVTDDVQFFHFYRNTKAWYAEKFARIYCFGIKYKGASNACYHFILPDDRMVVAPHDNIDLTLFNLRTK